VGRSTTGLVFVTALTAIVASSAVAATIFGTQRADVLRGTSKADTIYGKGGNDTIYGLGGNDRIFPGPGKDRVVCGAGKDFVQADALDVVANDCETVRRLSPPAPPPPPNPALGTRENPYPRGSTATLADGWKVTVASTIPDATAAVLAENQFNDPPASGNQFFIVRVTATYTGQGSKSFSGSFRLRAVGTSAVSYSTFANSCGVIPDEISSAEVFTGGTVTGNECWQVKSSDVASLVMYDDATFDQKIFFALR
jgi:hypothetical protein